MGCYNWFQGVPGKSGVVCRAEGCGVQGGGGVCCTGRRCVVCREDGCGVQGGGMWCAGRRGVVYRGVLHGGREEQGFYKQQKSRCNPQAAVVFYRMGVWIQVLNTE